MQRVAYIEGFPPLCRGSLYRGFSFIIEGFIKSLYIIQRVVYSMQRVFLICRGYYFLYIQVYRGFCVPPLASACKFKFDNLCAIYTCQAKSLLKFVHVLYFLFIINQSKNSISDYNIFTRVLKNNFIPSKIDNYMTPNQPLY